MKAIKYGVFSASIKDADAKKGIVTGYCANFNTMDSDNDIIIPGAFDKAIAEQGPNSTQPRIKWFLNHDTRQPIGKPLTLIPDSVGLKYEGQVGTHNIGVDFVKMVESELITEHSIGYGVVRKTVINPDADWRDQQTQLQELKLWEFSSLTAWGANQYTPLIGMKEYAIGRIPKLIKAIRNGTFTDETFGILEEELLLLQKAIYLDGTTLPDPAEGTTTPNATKNMLNQVKLLRLQLID